MLNLYVFQSLIRLKTVTTTSFIMPNASFVMRFEALKTSFVMLESFFCEFCFCISFFCIFAAKSMQEYTFYLKYELFNVIGN